MNPHAILTITLKRLFPNETVASVDNFVSRKFNVTNFRRLQYIKLACVAHICV